MRLPGRLVDFFFLALLALVWGCSDSDGGDDSPCDPTDPSACEGGLVCEEVPGAEADCFLPVVLTGRVVDLANGDGIADAHVLAMDPNGSPASAVTITDEEGDFELHVPAPRAEDGAPITRKVTLRVMAAGYRPFPQPPRVALPLDLADAVEEGQARLVLSNAATSVGLIALPADPDRCTLRGRVLHDAAPGTMVLAEAEGVAVAATVADGEGAFVLFDVPFGTVQVAGYRAGLVVTPRELEVDSDEITDVTLEATDAGLSMVSGAVTFADAPGDAETSVILVPAPSFDPVTIRGEAPAGLRADAVRGAFEIDGVPPGEWVVLAGFENDGLVRDPDEGISGTDVVHLTVPDGGGDVPIPQTFKVTGALAVVSPGAEGLDEVATPTPDLVWADDSSEDGYEVRVYDASGELVFEDVDVPRVTGGATVTHAWAGPPLEAGMIYQFRAWSFHDTKDGRRYISATEDLLGVFLYPAPR